MMKRTNLLLSLMFLVGASYAQTNTFPTDGNVGIGTANPHFKLDVHGNTRVLGSLLYNTLNYQTLDFSSWIKLGTLSLSQGGSNACIRIYGGRGFNAALGQQGYTEFHMRTSNGGSVDGNGYPFSAFAFHQGRNRFVEQIKIVPGSMDPQCNSFDIYIYCGTYIGNSFYSVESSNGLWNPSNIAVSDPSPGYRVPYETVVNNNAYFLHDVGIGTDDTQGYKLAIAGNMIAESVKVKLKGSWPDYVFRPSHELPSLQYLETFIQQHQHLPEMPSASEIEKDGVDLGGMSAKLLKKIEELTLYVIDLKKENEQIKEDNRKQQEEIELLRVNR